AQPIGSGASAGEQDLLQADARDPHAWTDSAPEVVEVGLAQSLAALIEESPAREARRRLFDGCAKAERAQHVSTVGMQRDSCSDRWPSGAALDNLGGKALPLERGCQGETGDASTYDEYLFYLRHGGLP